MTRTCTRLASSATAMLALVLLVSGIIIPDELRPLR
jgi:hypothetical protein